MADCCIALGGNIGNSQATFEKALVALADRGVEVQAMSSVISTAPMGAVAGDVFSNAAATVSTKLSAGDLLQTLHEVEAECGRVRTVHWGPRSLDLDLLLYDDLVIDSEVLVVPHPSMWYRRFVLAPLNEIAAERIHPIFGESVEQLHVRLLNRPLAVELAMPDGITIAEVEEALPEDDFLTLQPVDTRSGQGSDCFARLAEGESRETRQPALQTERIVRVTRADSDEERINLWKQAIRDFFSAVAG